MREYRPSAVPTPGPYGNIPSNLDRAQVQALCTALTEGAPPNLYSNPCSGAGVPVLIGQLMGSPDLEPETADTFTVGAVVSVDNLPLRSRLSLSVDYYNIC